MLLSLFKAMRPKQWSKNVFVLAALVFDLKLLVPEFLGKSLAAFVIFCAVSSAVYLINDLADIEKDRQHPVKRNRPLASGKLSPRVAVIAALLLVGLSLPLAFWLDPEFMAIVAGYFVMMILYSFWLKQIVLIDVLTVAGGFVLRVVAGVVLVNTARFSPWLYLCMVLLALFIAISKRRHELVLLQGNANAHRSIFEDYSLPLLDDMTRMVTACTAMAYSLYTFSAPNLPQNHAMMLTTPFVYYGLFRYMYLVHIKNEGGEPEDLVLKDRPLLATVVLWGLVVVLVLYRW
ncbi:MAG: Decaprenyl-phosphate phosphoribosyltransferase [Chloroflexi bacterium ADurb.Bin180]|nr:MAG: Decaprenyl-phosphate phosphoribosyltransferase [Chloroflexi bacterium ADurb.Bin180]HNR96242.1 decaprenyl-phosphate phosphoribosyltransferase [Anaerolineae bacterium]HNT05390.1 decaprenyl-phosphate phosphoribosyltransferase [Anaerolineae bacterium]